MFNLIPENIVYLSASPIWKSKEDLITLKGTWVICIVHQMDYTS